MTEVREAAVEVAIIGAGFSGIAAAAGLLRDGVEVLVLERSDDVGGCWRDNTYPGCQCDVPSSLYSYSFLPGESWSRTYAPRAEIHGYLQRATERLGVAPHVRLGCEVLEATWDDATQRWRLVTTTGTFAARYVVAAAGPLAEPRLPDVPGVGSFRGVAMHTARWRRDVDLSGLRVAVVGTGASAIQVVPRLQPLVSRLVVFQRTPPWVLPHTDRPLTALERAAYRRFPTLRRLPRAVAWCGRELLVPGLVRNGRSLRLLEALGRRNLRRGIADEHLRARLEPTYRAGCKRLLLSDDWYPALSAGNVEVVTEALAEVRPASVVAAGGVEHEVDAVVYATGFEVVDSPIAARVRGRDGRTLAESWDGSPRAHLGTTVAGFPNLFLLVGPNTGLGHSSIVYMVEAQVRYLRDAVARLARLGAASFDVRPEVQQQWDDEVQRRMAGSVWTAGGCASWYLDAHGRNSTLWPGTTWRFRRLLRRFDPQQHELRQRAGAVR